MKTGFGDSTIGKLWETTLRFIGNQVNEVRNKSLGEIMRALTSAMFLAILATSCAHDQKTERNHCPKCGALLFFADPGITTIEDIREFARRSKLENRDKIVTDGWIHSGAYCPNGDYQVLYEIKRH